MPDNYRIGRRTRRSSTRPGPIGFLGRGRVALLAIMLALLAMAHLASDRSVLFQGSAPGETTFPNRETLPAGSRASETVDPRIGLINPTYRPTTVQQHGGLLSDGRAALVARIADRLSAAARASGGVRLPDFQFGVLADESARRVYAFSDGWLLVTAGLIQVAANENEVAAVLAEAMETMVRSVNSLDDTTPQGTISVTWLAQAGFNPDGIASFRARLATVRRDDAR